MMARETTRTVAVALITGALSSLATLATLAAPEAGAAPAAAPGELDIIKTLLSGSIGQGLVFMFLWRKLEAFEERSRLAAEKLEKHSAILKELASTLDSRPCFVRQDDERPSRHRHQCDLADEEEA